MLQRIINFLNDLRPRQILMLAIGAAVLMLITVYFGINYAIKEKTIVIQPVEEKAPPPPPEVTKTAVVVAKTTIMPRTRIQDTMIQM